MKVVIYVSIDNILSCYNTNFIIPPTIFSKSAKMHMFYFTSSSTILLSKSQYGPEVEGGFYDWVILYTANMFD